MNINAKTTAGDTARSLALMNGHTKIVSLIDNYHMTVSATRRVEPGTESDILKFCQHNILLSSSKNFVYLGPSVLRPPVGPRKCGLILQVVLK